MAQSQRWALGLEYLGDRYHGWQRQSGQPSVQQALEEALSSIATVPVSVTAAGRTDTGVHAALQVVHFETDVARDATAWVRGGNQFLPNDIAVRWAQPVADDFHARFAATSRKYVYLLSTRPQRPALHATRVGWTHWPMEIARITDALPGIVGTHDFTSFRASECQAKSPVKTVYSATASERNGVIRLDFHANAFLHHMIRNVVGALVYIGANKQPVDWMSTLLALKDRTQAAPTFSPAGLYLAGIDYDARFNLPENFVDPCL
ncbi:MAG: tRNA pseudouridine(38-40) synthase TruA [Betaproteobacteria bacterium]|nr:MAG: tRNA pseudouridine(38-40) synthase TruA [Betaproteobacteria bacterium]TAG46515.1 MAG: tRNA pseudouridine(38-40) synthase TruA [Betaproteobacteria bacterium]